LSVKKSWDFRNSGLKAALYQHDASGQFILAFSGTNGINKEDWLTNIGQAIGVSGQDPNNQYNKLKELVSDAQNTAGGTIHMITGHSLGGGLATLAKLLYRKDSDLVIFNPAYLNMTTIKNVLGNENPDIFFANANVWHESETH
jgi:predicted esterase YcpF (UPF0227 family)